MFYLLRKWFIKISCTPTSICVKKGIGFSTLTTIRICDIVRVSSRQPLLLRLLRAKEVELFCVCGSVKFYMKADETLPVFSGKCSVRPKTIGFRKQAFLAFCETHALVGAAAFSLVIFRASRLFNGEYSEQILKAISETSQSVYEWLLKLNIDISKVLVTAAVFIAASWCFAYIRNLLKFMRFSSEIMSGFAVIKHGTLTLYEHRITLNSIAVREDNPLTLITGSSPMKMRGVIICLSQKQNNNHQRFRPSSFWNYCKIPAVLILAHGFLLYCTPAEHTALPQLLFVGVCLLLYDLCVSILYMRHSGITIYDSRVCVSAQRMQRFYSAVIPKDEITQTAISHFLKSKRCNITVLTAQRQRFKVRQIDLKNQNGRCR